MIDLQNSVPSDLGLGLHRIFLLWIRGLLLGHFLRPRKPQPVALTLKFCPAPNEESKFNISSAGA